VLLLDELSAVRPTDWVRDTLAHIINSRYNEKKVTLVTTTLTLEAEQSKKHAKVLSPSGEELPNFEKSLAQLGPTLCSRLYEMCRVVEMEGIDYRKDVKQASFPRQKSWSKGAAH
jgi:DNA replication protein DnaC